jgi:hypothetical protein
LGYFTSLDEREKEGEESNAIDGKSKVEKKQAIHGRVGTD